MKTAPFEQVTCKCLTYSDPSLGGSPGPQEGKSCSLSFHIPFLWPCDSWAREYVSMRVCIWQRGGREGGCCPYLHFYKLV